MAGSIRGNFRQNILKIKCRNRFFEFRKSSEIPSDILETFPVQLRFLRYNPLFPYAYGPNSIAQSGGTAEWLLDFGHGWCLGEGAELLARFEPWHWMEFQRGFEIIKIKFIWFSWIRFKTARTLYRNRWVELNSYFHHLFNSFHFWSKTAILLIFPDLGRLWTPVLSECIGMGPDCLRSWSAV